MGYFLKRYRDEMVERAKKMEEVQDRLRDYELRLRKALEKQPVVRTYSIDGNGTHHHNPVVQIQLPELENIQTEET
jgi:hypothetical protein